MVIGIMGFVLYVILQKSDNKANNQTTQPDKLNALTPLYQPSKLFQDAKSGNLAGQKVTIVFRIRPVCIDDGSTWEYRPGYPVERVKPILRMRFSQAVPVGKKIDKIEGIVDSFNEGMVEIKDCRLISD